MENVSIEASPGFDAFLNKEIWTTDIKLDIRYASEGSTIAS